MKNEKQALDVKWRFFESKIWKILAILVLTLSNATSKAGGEHTYLEEGNLLAERLIRILIEEQVCASIIDCGKRGGFAFVKPVKRGVEISVYSIKSDLIAAKVLQACAFSFATRLIGQEMVASIYNLGTLERMNQSSFNKASPTFTLKLEKQNGNR